jgi:hypothetical protein
MIITPALFMRARSLLAPGAIKKTGSWKKTGDFFPLSNHLQWMDCRHYRGETGERLNTFTVHLHAIYHRRVGRWIMATKKIETVCGFSCSDCDHHKKDCPGCEKVTGKPFWTAFVNIDQCPIYECCTTLKNLPHCGKCSELVCERFTRFKNPEMTDEQAAAALATAEKELRCRK